MPNAKLLEPVSEDDPCGPDMRWDQAVVQFTQDFELFKSQQEETAVIEGELAGSSGLTAEELINTAEGLCTQTKDLRIMAAYAEAHWHDGGVGAFSEAMEDVVSAIETWPGVNDGVYPRADEDDGDLSERMGPLSLLLRQIPTLANTIGWGGNQPEISEREKIAGALNNVFNSWSSRLGDAFEASPPSCIDALKALKPFLESTGAPAGATTSDEGGGTTAAGAATQVVSTDAWDLVEKAAEMMALQDRHSPALPLLRLMSQWRSMNIMEIAERMKISGVALEQLLDSIKKQQSGEAAQPGGPAQAGAGAAPAAPAPSQHPGLAR